MLKIITTLASTTLALLLIGASLLYSGVINVAADDPHSALIAGMLELGRDRSIAVRAEDIEVPDLNDADLVRSGAGNYDALCIACHLAPGLDTTDLHQNLYPRPAVLAHSVIDQDPARTFWTIKHGIKGTGMPAWGRSMTDENIWGLVAFLEQLPSLGTVEYQAVVASSRGQNGIDPYGAPAPNAQHTVRNGQGAEDTQPVNNGSLHFH